jgi:hypothetical protein
MLDIYFKLLNSMIMEYLVLFAPSVNGLATKRNDEQVLLTVEELTVLIDMLEDERLRRWSEENVIATL